MFVHPRNPYTRVDILPSSRPVRVEVDGVVIAETTSARLLFETGLPTRYYLPKTHVRMDLLRPTAPSRTARTRGRRSTGRSPSTATCARTPPGRTRRRCPRARTRRGADLLLPGQGRPVRRRRAPGLTGATPTSASRRRSAPPRSGYRACRRRHGVQRDVGPLVVLVAVEHHDHLRPVASASWSTIISLTGMSSGGARPASGAPSRRGAPRSRHRRSRSVRRPSGRPPGLGHPNLRRTRAVGQSAPESAIEVPHPTDCSGARHRHSIVP